MLEKMKPLVNNYSKSCKNTMTSSDGLRKWASATSSLNILTRCVNVRQQYLMRVQHPSTTDALTSQFDKEIEGVLTHWLGPLQNQQVEIARLPVKKGGLGLTATHPLREAAHTSSKYAAQERQNSFSARAHTMKKTTTQAEHLIHERKMTVLRPPEDDITETVKLHNKTWEKLMHEPKLAAILKVTSYKGNNDWLMSNTRLVPPRNFELTIMPRLGIVHPKLPRNLTCPGCKIILDGNTALTHIPGCVRCSGLNATVKHNALVKYIGDLCIRAGIPCEIEPRAFTMWTCQACNANVNYENKVHSSKNMCWTNFPSIRT